MSEAQIKTRRRSLRIWINIPVRASGKDADGKDFSEDTQTIVVNAHGGLLFLQQPVKVGTEFLLTNRDTKEEQPCRVVTLRGPLTDKGMDIGIEFLLPSPHFWGVDFPPAY